MVSSEEKPHNYRLYSINSDLDSFILYDDGDINTYVTKAETDITKIDPNQTQAVNKTLFINLFLT